MIGDAKRPVIHKRLDAWSLGMEASAVVSLRIATLVAGGSAASREAELMVAEKIRAGLDLAVSSFGIVPSNAIRWRAGD